MRSRGNHPNMTSNGSPSRCVACRGVSHFASAEHALATLKVFERFETSKDPQTSNSAPARDKLISNNKFVTTRPSFEVPVYHLPEVFLETREIRFVISCGSFMTSRESNAPFGDPSDPEPCTPGPEKSPKRRRGARLIYQKKTGASID